MCTQNYDEKGSEVIDLLYTIEHQLRSHKNTRQSFKAIIH